MAGTISNTLRNKLLQAYFQPDVYTADETLFVALTGSVGTANAPGDTLDEPAVSVYARTAVDLTSDWWNLSGGGEMFNIADIDFPAPIPGEDWGYLAGWALLDAPDGGMTYAVGSLIVPILFTSDQPQLSLGPGGITVGLYD